MADKLTRVRIIHDSTARDPRHDMDFMCEIKSTDGLHRCTLEAELIRATRGFRAALELIASAAGDVAADELDENVEYDDALRATWLEQLKGELLVMTIQTGYRCGDDYVVHTTPEMCATLGVKWEDAEKAMAGEVEMFEQWAEGDVYGFVIEEADAVDDPDDPDAEPDEDAWEEVDACWGFYGSDPATNGMLDHVPEELHDMLREAEVEYEY